MTKGPIGIAGTGRVGQALGRILYDAGLPVVAVAGRTKAHASAAAAFVGAGVQALGYADLPRSCSRLIIAVPDDALSGVACLLRESGWKDGIVIHTSGVNGTDVLDCLAAQGSSCAALHPLQTVPSPEKGRSALLGCQYVLTGRGEAAEWAREIVDLLGGRLLELPDESRALYHAAAVLLCNDFVVLAEAGFRLLQEAGLSREAAARAFVSLAEESVRNVFTMKRGDALTGPVARGDIGTVRKHLNAFRSCNTGNDEIREIEAIYRVLGQLAIRLAREQGLDESTGRGLSCLLENQQP
ncbi:MAG: Rossmann-like and DUF2520 domain-containing protein [Acidobacteriota bacterium]